VSIARRATRGAIWNVGASTGARLVGLVGSLIMTRFLPPDVVGEVNSALVIAMTANWVSNWGFNQYMIVHGARGTEQTFHAAVVNLSFGLLALFAITFTGAWFAPMFHAPHLASYLPGLALAIAIRRIGSVPDKVLAREMRFRELAVANSAGAMSYPIVVISLAAAGFGGQAMVAGQIVQAMIATTLILATTGLGWLVITPWRWQRVREMVRFGLPLGVAQLFDFGSRYWDNLLFGAYFGPKVVGYYTQAYNLADIPAVQVGEQISEVLLPAMANLDAKERQAALIRSTALTSLVVFPLAVGLGAVAPTLVASLLNRSWQGVAPLLVALSVLSVVRPMSWGVLAYLASYSRTRTIMVLQIIKLVLLFSCIVAFHTLGPVWTAAAVGIAFGTQSLISIALVIWTDRIPAWPLASAFIRPLAACAVMAAAVIGMRQGLLALDVDTPRLLLPIEVVTGAVAYIGAALVLAGSVSRDFLQLLRRALQRDA
jgi:lipopolysaccharide exporter